MLPEIGDGVAPAVIHQVIRGGATHIVTAPGMAARALGTGLANGWSGRAAVILRLAPPADLARARLGDWIDLTVLGACRDLGIARLHTVLLPDPAGARGAAMLDHLRDAQSRGVFRHLGIAVVTPAAAHKWLKRSEMTHIELATDRPARGLAAALAARPEVMMVARPPVDGLKDALGQAWAQGAVMPLPSLTAWPSLIDAARMARR